MTLEELTADLGWGLHDALVQRLHIDWAKGELRLHARLKTDKAQKFDRLAEISITGLQYCVVEPPAYEDSVEKTVGKGLWTCDVPDAEFGKQTELPPTPAGCFAHHLFVQPWNSYIHICGRDAKLEWLEPEPVPVARPNLYWPGDEIPDSES